MLFCMVGVSYQQNFHWYSQLDRSILSKNYENYDKRLPSNLIPIQVKPLGNAKD